MTLPLSLLHPEVMQNPYPVYRHFRENDPLHFVPGRIPHYVLTRHPDVWNALKHKDLSRDLRRSHWDEKNNDIPPEHLTYARTVREWVVFKEAPEHRPLRATFNRIVAASFGEGFRGWVREVAKDVFSHLPTKPGSIIDLSKEYALMVTTRVVTDLLGISPLIDPLRLGIILSFMQKAISSAYDYDIFTQASSDMEELEIIIQKALDELTADTMRADFLRALAEEFQLGNLTPTQILPSACFLLMASQDNARSMITNGVYLLLSHGLWPALRENPDLIPGAVRETIRMEPSLHMIARNATADLEIAGQLVREGEGIICCLAAANRDPSVFENPDTFDWSRDTSKLLTFGNGIHRCPGEKMSSFIIQEALGVLLEAWPNPKLGPGEIEWTSSPSIRALPSLPIMAG